MVQAPEGMFQSGLSVLTSFKSRGVTLPFQQGFSDARKASAKDRTWLPETTIPGCRVICFNDYLPVRVQLDGGMGIAH